MDVTDKYLDWLNARRSPSARGVTPRVVATQRGDALDLSVRFLSGQSYCCMEPGCHFGLHSASAWAKLDSAVGFQVAAVNIAAFVEPGAVISNQATDADQHYDERLDRHAG